ncbi:MAG: hypothetical protein B6I38_05585 [Anaerolineaceae bacterium 4572_5.1]|nr:MAG: hypothetical protein B6I38_05585 [Anaerolineaceae bacterium 4572_5.1]
MKFLIAGLGSIGRRHLRMLRELGQEDIVLYRTHQSTLDDEGLAGIPVETDLRDALRLDATSCSKSPSPMIFPAWTNCAASRKRADRVFWSDSNSAITLR